MRMTNLFTKTLRSAPVEAELQSHKLLIQSGMIQQVSSGVYTYLPLGLRSIKKIEGIIREEMESAGAQELKLSILQPRDLWKTSGRDDIFGPDMIRLIDRRNRDFVLPPTNEELVTETFRTVSQSYRDLPVILYQIQTKFRDEVRPRGGLIRVREFDMMDAYSFDTDEEGLGNTYDRMILAYEKIFERCGLETIIADADSGPIGGKDSKEFLLLTDSGEDSVIICQSCDYAANNEKATFKKVVALSTLAKDTKEVHTPGIKTIDDLTRHLGIEENRTLKSVLYYTDKGLILAAIRGDLDINESKLKNELDAKLLRLATEPELRDANLNPGFVSPVNLEEIPIVVDDSLQPNGNYVAGGNKSDYHLLNVNVNRDFRGTINGDIALAKEGYACVQCEGSLLVKRGIEIGHVFKLGTQYSESMDVSFSDPEGELNRVVMGCYGIGIGRILAGLIEQKSDEHGIVFTRSVAPYEVIIVGLNTDNTETVKEADKLYEKIRESGIEVLYDDRPETAGVKFNDTDLLGIPLRLVIGSRNLTHNNVELKLRGSDKAFLIDLENVISEITTQLQSII